MINNSKPHPDNCNDHEDDCNHSSDHCNDVDCCHDDHHHNNCCHTPCTDAEACKLKPNCVAKCCNPLVCECEDVEQSHCVPILAQKIFDCLCLDQLQFAEFAGGTFTIENFDATTMKSGMPICIDKVSTTYDFIGTPILPPATLTVKVGKINVPLTAVCPSATLADCFEGCIKTTKACCDGKEGIKTRISTTAPVAFSITNLVTTVTGRIGCVCFKANSAPGGTQVISGLFPAISDTSIFSKICLPKESTKLKLSLCFDSCLSVDCVVPSPATFTAPAAGAAATFTADIEVSFLVNSEIIATTSEKLGVFVTDKDIKCHTGSSDSGCKSKCH